MKNVLRMAGNLTSHALWGVSEADGLTTIVGYLRKDGSSKMVRLALDADEAIREGQNRINNLGAEDTGASLISDGYVTLDSGKTDTLVVDIRFSDDANKNIQYLIPYRCASDEKGFGIYSLKVTKFDGISREYVNEFTHEFIDGIESHEQGGRVWKDFKIDARPQVKATAKQEKEDVVSVVLFAPFIVFLLVSGIDGRIDEKEFESFYKMIMRPEKYGSGILTQISKSTGHKVTHILDQLLEKKSEMPHFLLAISKYVDENIPKDDGDAFKKALYAIGEDVAKSSGGFLGFGSKISNEEKNALEAIKSILKV